MTSPRIRMPQVSDENQEQVKKLLAEIIERANRFSLIFEGLSPQDKVMAGSLVLGIYNPWTEVESIFFVGTKVMVPPVIDKITFDYRNRHFNNPLPKIKMDDD